MVHLDNVIHMYVYLDINYILYLNVHLNFKILEAHHLSSNNDKQKLWIN